MCIWFYCSVWLHYSYTTKDAFFPQGMNEFSIYFSTVDSLYLNVPWSFKQKLNSLRTIILFFSDRKIVMRFHWSHEKILSKFPKPTKHSHPGRGDVWYRTGCSFHLFVQFINRWQQIALLPLICGPEGYTHFIYLVFFSVSAFLSKKIMYMTVCNNTSYNTEHI